MKFLFIILICLPIFNLQASSTTCRDSFGLEFRNNVNESLSKQYDIAFKDEFKKIMAKEGVTVSSEDIDFKMYTSASYIYKGPVFYSHQFYFEVPEKVKIKVNGSIRTFDVKTEYEDNWIFASGAGNNEPKVVNGLKECTFFVAFYDYMYSTISDTESGAQVGFLQPGVVAEFKKIIP